MMSASVTMPVWPVEGRRGVLGRDLEIEVTDDRAEELDARTPHEHGVLRTRIFAAVALDARRRILAAVREQVAVDLQAALRVEHEVVVRIFEVEAAVAIAGPRQRRLGLLRRLERCLDALRRRRDGTDDRHRSGACRARWVLVAVAAARRAWSRHRARHRRARHRRGRRRLRTRRRGDEEGQDDEGWTHPGRLITRRSDAR